MKRSFGSGLVLASVLLGFSGCSKQAATSSTTVAANPASSTSTPSGNASPAPPPSSAPTSSAPASSSPPPGASKPSGAPGQAGAAPSKPTGAPGAAGSAPSKPSGAPGSAGGMSSPIPPPGSSNGFPGMGGSGPGMGSSSPGPGSSGSSGYPGAGAGGYPGAGAGGYPGAGSGSTGYPGAPGGSGYPGAPGSSGPGAPGGAGDTATPPEPPRELTLRERAEDYYSKGQEVDAHSLIQAHMLTSSAESEDYLNQVRWSATRKQPALIARIAVGVDVKGTPTNGNYNPVGSKQGANGGMGRGPGGPGGGDISPGSGGSSGFPGSGAPSGSSGSSSLTDITGDMGEAVISRIQELFSSGQLGTVFSGIEDKATGGGSASGAPGMGAGGGMAGMGGRNRPGGAPGGAPGAGGAPGGGYPGAGGNNNFENSLDGSIGTSNSAGSSPPPGGYPGAGGMGAGGMGSGFGGAPGGAAAPPIGKLGTPNPKRLTPGLTYLGVASSKDLQEKALDQNFDALIVFEVTLEGRLPKNLCRAKLYKPGEKKALGSSEQLVSTDANRKIMKGEMEVVEKAMKKFLDKVSENCSLRDLPNPSSDQIQKRTATLIADKSRPTLEILAELKVWNNTKLLSDDEYKEAVKQILNSDGATKLTSGTDEDKKTALKRFIP